MWYGDVFVKEKESSFLWGWLFPNGKENKAQTNMDIENCKFFLKKEIFGKEFYVWSGINKIGINLIK